MCHQLPARVSVAFQMGKNSFSDLQQRQHAFPATPDLGRYSVNSRQRVLAALRHEEPDKVPVDFGATTNTGIVYTAYKELRDYLGLPSRIPRVYDLMQMLAEVDQDVRELFQVDCIGIERLNLRYGLSNARWKTFTMPNGEQIEVSTDFSPEIEPDGALVIKRQGHSVARMPANGYWFDATYFPLAEAKSPADLKGVRLPDWPDEELEVLHQTARQLYEETEYAIVGTHGGGLFQNGHSLRGFEQWMLDLGGDPEMAEAVLDLMLDQNLRTMRAYLDAVGDYIQVVKVGDDLGTQTGPFMSLAMFRRLFKPRYREFYGYIKQRCPHLHIYLHSCGAVSQFIPDLIECGVDILNPVQISAAGMDPVRLKAEYGDRLTFWGGGIDTQRTLPFGTTDEVRAEVKRLMDIFAPGGGFVWGTVHNIQAKVPAANIAAMFESVQENRAYSRS